MASFFGFQRLQARPPQLASPTPARRHRVFRTQWLGNNQARRPAAARQRLVLTATSQPIDSNSGGSNPSPLQCRLAEMGVVDWRAYDKLRHPALVGEEEVEQFAAKVVEMAREGVTAEDVERLFAQHDSPHACSLEGVFLPNLAYLRGLLAGAKVMPKDGEPAGLTPLGRLLRRQPSTMALLLSRRPELVLELDRWVCGELGVASEDLAAAALKAPIILRISVDAGRSVVAFFEGELGLPREQVKRLLLQKPAAFTLKPGTMREKVGKLGNILGVDHLRAGQLMVSIPRLFGSSFNELPAVLSDLDALFGREGAGAALILQEPILAALSLSSLRRSLDGLLKLGLDEGAVGAQVDFDPSLLLKDLGTELQQLKRAWAEAELNWPLQKMFANRLFSYSLSKMASRLAFMRQLGLPDPGSLWLIGSLAEPKFLEQLSRSVGQEVGKAEFDAFVAEWLRTEQGRKYGSKPDTVPRGRRKPDIRE